MKPAANAVFSITVMSVAILAGSALLAGQQPKLPDPSEAHPNRSKAVPKPDQAGLKAPAGFTVDTYADNIQAPRMMVYAPDGDLFVSQAAASTVAVFRDTNNDGLPDQRSVFVQGPLPAGGGGGGGQAAPPAPAPCVTGNGMGGRQPFGLAFHEGYLYVGFTDCLVRYKYQTGDTTAQGKPEVLANLPSGGGHFTRNVLFSQDGKKVYVSVGSASNNNDYEEPRRAAILEFNPDGTGFRVFASGIRNPVGLALQPGTNIVWTAVNERDNLGDDLVPDYVTSVKDGGFYGWPYSYIGSHYDPLHVGKMQSLVKTAIVPDVLMPAHGAALGINFYTATQFPQHYRNGAFVGLHGSWNRSKAAGYKVVYIPFQNAKPSGPPEDFVTGFVVNDGTEGQITTWGRPVGVSVAHDGSLLVSDDVGNRIWRVRYTGGK